MRLLCAGVLAVVSGTGMLFAAEAPSTVVRKGQSLSEVRKIFAEAKAQEITVGILFGTSTDNDVEGCWYVTKHKTAVGLKFERPAGKGDFLLVDIEAGELGKGYPGKFEWMAQKHRDLDSFDLSKE